MENIYYLAKIEFSILDTKIEFSVIKSKAYSFFKETHFFLLAMILVLLKSMRCRVPIDSFNVIS